MRRRTEELDAEIDPGDAAAARMDPARPGADRPAHPLARIAAFAVDYVVLAGYIGLLVGGFMLFGPESTTLPSPARGQLLGFTLLTLPVVLYFGLLEASTMQATLGKRVLGLRVVDEDGGRLPPGRSLVRSALKFLPWEIAHTCLWRIPGWPFDVEVVPAGAVAGLVVVWILIGWYVVAPWVSARRQAPYDRIARCLVVRAAVENADRSRRRLRGLSHPTG